LIACLATKDTQEPIVVWRTERTSEHAGDVRAFKILVIREVLYRYNFTFVQMNDKKPTMTYIKGFDGLRAISILLVLAAHLGLESILKPLPMLGQYYNLISGNTGVMIFFTISGFLITSLLLTEKKNTGRIHLKNFFIRRFLRLLPPLILFYAAVLFLMAFHLLEADYTAVALSFFYLYNFAPFTHYTNELSHTWSLGVEEQFYLIWPFLINRIRTHSTLLFACVIIIILCLIGREIFLQSMIRGENTYNLGQFFYISRWFIPACLPIMTGALTSVLIFNRQELISKVFHRNYVIPVLAFLLFIGQVFIPSTQPGVNNVLQPGPGIIALTQPLSVAAFLLWIYFNQDSLPVRILEFKPFALLGKISYGVYVYQGLFLTNGPTGHLPIQHYPLNILLVFATALLSYFFYEKKILRYKSAFTSR